MRDYQEIIDARRALCALYEAVIYIYIYRFGCNEREQAMRLAPITFTRNRRPDVRSVHMRDFCGSPTHHILLTMSRIKLHCRNQIS